MLRKHISISILVILVIILYLFRTSVTDYSSNVISILREYYSPCSLPITYKIGIFDEKFGISKDYFLSAISDAEAIWELPFGKELFTYDALNGQLDINLKYDYRQEASSNLQSLGTTVDINKTTYDELDAKYKDKKNLYNQTKTAYEIKFKIFEARRDAYEQKVSYWNQKGGAPRREYDEIQSEQVALQSELSGLQKMEKSLNTMVDEINALVVAINRLASSLNLTVGKYNTIGLSLGDSFEEGLYHSDGIKEQIDIYEFKNRDNLVRVLAHEFGHALNLDHVLNKDAIMYSYNKSTNMNLTEDDLSALKIRCGVK